MDGLSGFRGGESSWSTPPHGETASSTLSADLVEAILDHIPQMSFSVKDCALRYVSANRAMLDLCGVRSRSDIIGKTSGDFFPDAVRSRYEILDRQVIRTRRAIKEHLDFTLRFRGPPVWVLLGRWPVIGVDRSVVGVAITARILETPDRRNPRYDRIATVIDHMQANFGAPFNVANLARQADVSVSRLERDFNDLFGMPPRRYFMKIRLEAALELLLTDRPIVDVAYACGYADQAAFSRRFHSIIGMSPSAYRRQSRVNGASAALQAIR